MQTLISLFLSNTIFPFQKHLFPSYLPLLSILSWRSRPRRRHHLHKIIILYLNYPILAMAPMLSKSLRTKSTVFHHLKMLVLPSFIGNLPPKRQTEQVVGVLYCECDSLCKRKCLNPKR
ncbi:unnamed protein product [Vicia faba]|uniref:Uncharacterized protein n=1 Tax=Vicia faba TaxID=3906 RepID=A0AAV0ZFV3_VICFA|nr:unnamed protein product [Vicia faba]